VNDQSFDIFYYVLLLILPISALAARRLPIKDTLKMALTWVAIFGVLYILVYLWQQATGTGAALGGLVGG
jgi:aspartyl protease family protein